MTDEQQKDEAWRGKVGKLSEEDMERLGLA